MVLVFGYTAYKIINTLGTEPIIFTTLLRRANVSPTSSGFIILKKLGFIKVMNLHNKPMKLKGKRWGVPYPHFKRGKITLITLTKKGYVLKSVMPRLNRDTQVWITEHLLIKKFSVKTGRVLNSKPLYSGSYLHDDTDGNG